ncbi:ATP-dependent DNA ligase [Ornithinimicrobium pekingense]|uniref:DNA ligase (ATP) n=1 Tax=Ornithinimicrobium pekingense TaxID=384677 RepID=A0ABQ2F6G4_9MICO|nr:ATP-dependent DNA ligase [Ornithinimicrobium pekingense]GGK55979.1 putative DNA ligase [Ornithinimicrobium pekingense]
MRLTRVIETSAAVAATRARNAKTALLASTLREAAQPDEGVSTDGRARLVAVVADYLAGTLPQRTVGVSWRGLRDLPPAADLPRLGVLEVDDALSRLRGLTGAGSLATRAAAVRDLFARATSDEQRWLVGLITGELRQGASDGVLLPAIAQAADVPETLVRRAVMLAGFPGPVAAAAMLEGPAALEAVRLEVGRPLRPMLAGSEPDVDAAVDGSRELAVDAKLDGIRLQAHVDRAADPQVRLFTRSLEEITDRLPEVVADLLALPATTAVLDGEVIALDGEGRPLPFQVTGARTASSADPQSMARTTPVTTVLFDLLHLDGTDLVDEPASRRWQALADLAPALAVDRVVTADPTVARDFFADVLACGHEGVVVKDPAAPYAAGRRGAGWVKVKPRRTADLVVLAVEWGSGRRSGWLSNIHLGARDPRTGELVMVGKTFKGMTDAILTWQTERFLELETGREEHVVHVRPEQVVEIAYDGVQTSRRYPGGIALRFARVLRYRDDKRPEEADTLDALRGTG